MTTPCNSCGTPVVLDHCVGDERNTGIVGRSGKVWCWECEREEDIRCACEENARQNAEMAEEERVAKAYPLTARLKTNRHERLVVIRFLEWASETHELELMKVIPARGAGGPRQILPPHTHTEGLFLEFLGIGVWELEEERNLMVAEMCEKRKEG